MSRSIPLGILAGSISALRFSVQGGYAELVHKGGVYADLANAKYFGFGRSATGTNTTTYNRSLNGVDWSTGTLPTSTTWARAAANATRVVVTSDASTTSGAYTDNGTTWTSTSIWASNTNTRDIIHDGTRFLAVTDNATTNLAHSTTGATWTRIDMSAGLYAIGYGDGRYVALQSGSTATHRTTTSDPTVSGDWSDITLPAALQWISVIYGNGIWVAHAGDTIAYSDNGTTWTSVVPDPQVDSNVRAAKMFYYGGKFYYGYGVGLANSNLRVYSSTNGATWNLEADFPQSTEGSDVRYFGGWADGPDRIIGFGYDNATDGAQAGMVGMK